MPTPISCLSSVGPHLAKSHGGLDFFDARLSEARAKSANDQATAKVPFSRIQSDGPSLAPPTDNTAAVSAMSRAD
jgi:hypothetical protein